MALRGVPAVLAAVSDGRDGEALTRLAQLRVAGDPESFLVSGLWHIEGRLLPRDLKLARAEFARAADLGHQGAARILGGMLAAGVGGDPDWAGALAQLDTWADRDPIAARQRRLINQMHLSASGDPAPLPPPEQLSVTPDIALIRRAFTPEECRMLIDLAELRLKPARIFHEGQQRFIFDPIRRSDMAGFPVTHEWPFVSAINRRIAQATGTTRAQGEPLQLLRYGPGQEYRPHLDAVPGLANQRILTALIYLNSDYAGGETHFTKAGVTVRGQLGDLLIFANVAGGAIDTATEHRGMPVSRGTKFIASRWIRAAAPAPGQSFGRDETG